MKASETSPGPGFKNPDLPNEDGNDRSCSHGSDVGGSGAFARGEQETSTDGDIPGAEEGIQIQQGAEGAAAMGTARGLRKLAGDQDLPYFRLIAAFAGVLMRATPAPRTSRPLRAPRERAADRTTTPGPRERERQIKK